MFWLWQQRNKCQDGTPCTEKLEIIPGYYGTSSSDSQGPTPELAPNTPLELGGRKSSDGQVIPGTPLRPFLKDDMGHYYVGEDCVNIETQMDYAYPPITEEERPRTAKKGAAPQKKLMVTGINRSLFQGSFVLEAYANVNGERHFLGHEAVLSRGNVARCANCLTHIEVAAAFPLNGVSEKLLSADAASNDEVTYNVNIHHRGSEQHPVQALAFSDRKTGELRGEDLPEKLSYNIQVVD
jgi:tyrosinase